MRANEPSGRGGSLEDTMAGLKRLILLALVALLPVAALAQANYPTRPVHLIVGFGAGSSSDVTARLLAQKLAELLGHNVIVENRPGASSMLAAEIAARAPKDGYTLLMATIANSINVTLMPDKGGNFEKDFAPVALVASIPEILVVAPSLEVNSVKDLIAMAKAKPDALFYGAAGIGSGPHMATELFKKEAGIKMTGVLYPGSAQTVTDLLAGRIQVMFAPVTTVVGLMKDGKVKPLASTQAKRASVAPDLPTIAEAAIPNFNTGIWYGVLAPAGTPQPVIEKLNKAINDALKDQTLLGNFGKQGLDPLGGTVDEFAAFIKSENQRWAEVVRTMDQAQTK
jgi:tripartite-type tricarboxylate transporter receptor subunit TctC